MTYRNTPPQGHTLSPAQRCFGRRTRGLLPIAKQLLVPNSCESTLVQTQIARKREDAKAQYDKRIGGPLQPLNVGDFAYVKPSPHHKGKSWPYGAVTELPSTRSYIVSTPDGNVRRNRRHVRPAAPPPPSAMIPRKWQQFVGQSAALSSPSTGHETPTHQAVDNATIDNHTGISVQDTTPLVPESPKPSTVATTARKQPQAQSNTPVVTKSGRTSKPRKILDL